MSAEPKIEWDVSKSSAVFITPPNYSKWKCYMFGSGTSFGVVYHPTEGNVPNAFWRWMQFICFGNRWVKDK